MIRFHGDGLSLTPAATAELLTRLTAESDFAADTYSRGGVVEQLESRAAHFLGKERAVFMPTGTLANHLAVRALCAGRGQRVLVQAESHLANDAGDCAQMLSGLNLIPLAPGRSCFTAIEIETVLARARSGRVATEVGALSLETPVRRLDNAAVLLAELEEVLAPARAAGIGLHLDGARLPLYAAHLGVAPHEVADLFDTVYLSLYKCFSAPAGAILAGPAELIDELYHARRMFGGGLSEAWPMAAIALHHFDDFVEISERVLQTAEDLWARLAEDKRCLVTRVSQGTNVFRLRLAEGNADAWREKLLALGVELPTPEAASGEFVCKMNPTWQDTTGDELATILLGALDA